MGENYRGFYKFLYYLHKAKILRLIKPKTGGDNIFTKPDKVYPNNTNLHYAYYTNQKKQHYLLLCMLFALCS